MKTTYSFFDLTLDEESTGASVLTNGFGDFFVLDPTCSYEGWFHLETNPWKLRKSIARIKPEGLEQSSFHVQPHSLQRTYTDGSSDSFILYQDTLLYYTKNISQPILLTLDSREAYDNSPLGREYAIYEKEGCWFIYFKQGDIEEFLCLKGVEDVRLREQWREEHYSFDASRGVADTFWVFDAFTFHSTGHTVIGRGTTESQARTKTDISSHHYHDVISALQSKVATYQDLPGATLREQLAFVYAQHGLYSLKTDCRYQHTLLTGIYAGLPWFFQLWGRDELISLGGFLAAEDFSIVEEILERYTQQVLLLEEVPNRFPPSVVASVDGLGWYAKRLHEYIRTRLAKNPREFSREELQRWHTALQRAYQKVERTRMREGLVFNYAQETWMDTVYEDSGREGFCVEIQALHLALIDAILYLERLLDLPFSISRDDFIFTVRKHFIRSHRIIDMLFPSLEPDMSYRPNLFLAQYISPTLFLKEDWKQTFKYALDKLFLSWGGLSTLSLDHPLYQPKYTGNNNKSYHRGDSWYFVNNIAAISLFEYSFQKEAKAILDASIQELFSLGFAGCSAEVSSASLQEGTGSLSQAWSSSTLIELLKKSKR